MKYLSKQCFCTRGGAEVATLVRSLARPALPALAILADGAVHQAEVVIAWASRAGQGGLVALDTGAALSTFTSEFQSNFKTFVIRFFCEY